MILQPVTLDNARYVLDNMRESDRREIAGTREHARSAAHGMVASTFGWCAGAGGRPIACIGVSKMWDGLGQAWMIATDDLPRIGLSLTRFVRNDMIPTLVANGIRTTHCYSIEGHTWAHRWLESLGARREATLEDWGRNGERFYLYRWHSKDLGHVHFDRQ